MTDFLEIQKYFINSKFGGSDSMAKVTHMISLALLALGLAMVPATHALADAAEQKALLERAQKVLADPALKEKAIQDGKKRIALCGRCHGKDGNSKKPHVPNLAGQNPAYLLEQMEKFADKRRKFRVMNVLTKRFTPADKVNLSVFWGTLKVKPGEYNSALAPEGKPLYNDRCQKCHGKKGLGDGEDSDDDALFARIAGQKEVYVINTLKAFRDAANNNLAPTAKIYRRNDKMEKVAKNLSDTDIEKLAAYVASLQ